MNLTCFHSLHQEYLLRVVQTLLEGLSQVTVGVLFTIDSLQIFFLNQNVNAFLGIMLGQEEAVNGEEKHKSPSEQVGCPHQGLPPTSQSSAQSKFTPCTCFARALWYRQLRPCLCW